MRCQPGDLAIILRAQKAELIGRVVEVIEWTPAGRVTLPDGQHGTIFEGMWLCRLVNPCDVLADYGCSPDRDLLPIRPCEGEETETSEELEETV